MRHMVAVITALLVATFLSLAGTGHASSRSRAASPSLQLLSPVGSVSVPEGGKIPVGLRITGVKMAPGLMGRKNVPGVGHLHFYVDCIPTNAYAIPILQRCWAGATGTDLPTFDLAASHVPITPGTHVLLIALAQNDHVLYPVPPVSFLFTVRRSPMAIRIVSPKGIVTVRKNGKIPFRLNISGLTLDPAAMGRANTPRHGHIHFYVDCIPPNAYSLPDLQHCWAGAVGTDLPTFALATSHVKITTGTHLLLIALAQNDHVLYPVPAADMVFTVKP